MTTNTSRPIILNVDDNEGCRYAVTRILEHNDFVVKEARTGAEALRIAASDQPDLVLLDINLPDINGFEVCKRLKAEPSTARIPVLHITASYVTGYDWARGLESGADSYLQEPVEPEVLVATINSILRARRSADAARALAREWQATFDAISDGVAVLDAEGRIQRCNVGLAALAGRPASEIVGSPWSALWGGLPPDKQPFVRALHSRQRESVEFDYDGKTLHLTVDPILDDDGAVTGAVQIASDVTEKRRLEEQFWEGQKFETIGTLAAGVAHDFNNLLTSIMGNASLVLSTLPAGSTFRDQLDDVVKSSQRAADLTKQLLAYSGKGRHFLQKLDLTSVVERTQNLIEATVGKKVSLEVRLARSLPSIEADANQLQQVILNLVSNAAEAIGEESGVIRIRTGVDASHRVYLEVRDTGCGMDSETRSRIFDPFFTTKFTGRGLGLAAVAGIARGHRATLNVNSSPGQGSTFRISFPAVEEVVADSLSRPQEDLAGSGTVLVVDDEDVVQRIARATLEMRGYRVLLASDGLEAIRAIRENPNVAVVLLDLTMPVMGGAEAVDEILSINPALQVIVSTGYSHQEAVARFGNKGIAGYLHKPYTSRQLAERVKTALTAGGTIR
jgi:PAS domain S-box-containing protein